MLDKSIPLDRISLMNIKPIAEFGPLDINKSYFVYDRDGGWYVARPYPVKNYDGVVVHVKWEFSNSDDLLVQVTHVAELPPNPFA